VHVNAVGAAVDLRGTQFGQFNEVRFETRFSDVTFQFAYAFNAIWGDFGVVETLVHFCCFFLF
jgi:hypothetical protein